MRICLGENRAAMALPKLKNTPLSENLGQMATGAREASAFLKALAHESRLMILCALAEGEKSVGDLEFLLDQRQSAVSQQLARLRLDGLVENRRDGKSVYYRLADDDVRTILQAIHSVFCRKPGGRANES